MSENSEVEEVAEAVETSRRHLLGKGALAAAAAAVAGVAIARPAAAANGGNMLIGSSNTGTATTLLSGGSTLRVLSGTSSGNNSIIGVQSVSGGNAILGVYDGTGAGYGIKGSTSSSGAAGVYGEHWGSSLSGNGVVGTSVLGYGVAGSGSQADLLAYGSGKILLSAAGAANPPVGGVIGTIARDGAGNLWYCHTAGQWRKLTGAGTSGSFHAIAPVRVYDSRAAAPAQGVMTANTSRVVSVKDGRAPGTGAVTAANVVPAGATAVTFNVTVTGAAGPNYLSVVPGDAAGFTTSSLNWNGGYDIANASVVKLDGSRQVKIFMGDQGGNAHVILDITGYYL